MFCKARRAPIAPEAEEELERRRQEDLRGAAAAAVASMSTEQIAAMVYRVLAEGEAAGGA